MFSKLTTALLLLATCAATTNAALSFDGASWIWGSDGGAPPPINLPVEQVALRKTISTPACTPPTSVEVLITADDAYTLYVNGVVVGSAESWQVPQYYCVLTNAMDIRNTFNNRVVIAILGANTVAPTPSGVLATVKLNYFDGTSAQFVTDSSWRSNLAVPSGFWQSPTFNDNSWPFAVFEEKYGGTTWRTVNIPGNQTCSLCSANTAVLKV